MDVTNLNTAPAFTTKDGSEIRELCTGDTVAIPPGRKHKLWNTGTEVLSLLCCCAPCYEDQDTFITEA